MRKLHLLSKATKLLNCIVKFKIVIILSKLLHNQNVKYFQLLKMVKTVIEEFENKRKNDIQNFILFEQNH